jgi:hypothetical protein
MFVYIMYLYMCIYQMFLNKKGTYKWLKEIWKRIKKWRKRCLPWSKVQHMYHIHQY